MLIQSRIASCVAVVDPSASKTMGIKSANRVTMLAGHAIILSVDTASDSNIDNEASSVI
ncbi:unnamed protein product [Periconia digitata]|uniref:Uncharacterized protein n=1 Tax=Periconia digitata TaxID=1303443 RepID=A0A9W4UBT7_9PLEO|nr:unnamed protein product [Periconia digitata]